MDRLATGLPADISDAYLITFSQVSSYIPRIFAALAILFIGVFLARWVRNIVVRSLELLQLSKVFKNTPVESFLAESNFSKKIEQVLGGVVYWLLMLLVFYIAVSVLGLYSLTLVLEKVLIYIPKIFAAIVILFMGVFVSGILESIVKGSIKTIGGRQARLLGKVASYLTMVIFSLAAISELGIAERFITILFIGFVTTITVSLSLAIGLGTKDLVAKAADDWYSTFKKETSEPDGSHHS